MKCPCEECVVLAMCLNKIERYKRAYLVSSLSKNCSILFYYLYDDVENGSYFRDRIVTVRNFFKDKKEVRIDEVSM